MKRTRAFSSMAVGALCILAVSACGSSTSSGNNAATKSGDFGTMKGICGGAVGKNLATGHGVSADSITLTTISDAGSSSNKGLNQELWDASDVFASWCNSLGGINGRKIKILQGDAQVTQYEQVIRDACNSSFALVGGGGTQDDDGQKDRVSCMLPDFPGLQSGAATRNSDLSFPGVNQPVQSRSVGLMRWIAKTYPASLGRIGYLYGGYAESKMIKEQVRHAGEGGAGWGKGIERLVDGKPSFYPVYQERYNLVGNTTWQTYATQLQANGVTGLVFEGQPQDLGRLLTALNAINYKGIQWIFGDANLYDQTLIQQAGSAIDVTKVYVPLHTVPFEDASGTGTAATAMSQYQSLFKKYAPNANADAVLGVDSFASWLLFAQAAGKCGADLTRKCLVAQVAAITSFDAGGLIAPTYPFSGRPSDCYTAVSSSSSGFKVVDVAPNRGVFNCSPDAIYTIADASFSDQYTTGGVRLSAVGKTYNDLP